MENGERVERSASQKLHVDLARDGSVSKWKLFLVTICFAGVQFGWALQIGQMTPFLQKDIMLTKVISTLVWLVGPLSGLLVQPIVGVISDNCMSKFGRRRPFIVGGAVAVAFSLLLIPNAPDIGALLGDEHSEGKNPGAIVFAVLGFAILDCANNMLQGPCRALLIDVAPQHQQEQGNSFFSIALAIGNCTGYLAGTVNWGELMPWLKSDFCGSSCASARFSFFVSVIFLAITVSMTCCSVKEIPLKRMNISSVNSHAKCKCCRTFGRVFLDIFRSIKNMPRSMIRVCLVQFFSWIAWFSFLVSISDWVGQDVNGGSPGSDASDEKKKLYEDGVRMAQFGLASYAALCFFFSPVVPWMISRFGPKITWAFGQVSQGICLCCTPLVHETYQAIILITFMGISWSVTMTVPYALTAHISPKEDRGLFMGVLNIFVVLPEFLLAVVSGFVIEGFGNHVYASLFMGGICGFIAAFLCVFLVVPDASRGVEHHMRHHITNSDASGFSSSPEDDEDVPILGAQEQKSLLPPSNGAIISSSST